MQPEDLLAAATGERTLWVAPRRILSGDRALEQLPTLLADPRAPVLVIGGPHSYPQAQARLEAALHEAGTPATVALYRRECSEAEVARMAALAPEACAVVGVGGGKALDAAKLVAARRGLNALSVPTSAATCAAYSALSNVYSPEGQWLYGVPLPSCPDALVLDYSLVATAPPRLLASGIGDALAKWVESSASVDLVAADALTFGAVEVARLLYERLQRFGEAALAQARAGASGDAFRQVVDGCILLAGLVGGMGGAKARSVAAHAVANALTARPGAERSWHGEKVAYGLVVQRVLQGFSPAPLDELTRLLRALELPLTLSELGADDRDDALEAIAAHVAGPASSAHLLPGGVTAERIVEALRRADALGRRAVLH